MLSGEDGGGRNSDDGDGLGRCRMSFKAARWRRREMFSLSKICWTRVLRSDDRRGWTYSGDMRRLASMFSSSFERAEQTV